MERFRKFTAYYLFMLFIGSTLSWNNLEVNSFWYWVIAIPAYIGAGWIIDKLDKIK